MAATGFACSCDGNHHSDDKKIGLLSYSELEDGMALADDLKFDKNVWIVHTGDHFITMRRQNNDSTTTASTVSLEIYVVCHPLDPQVLCGK